VIVVNLGSSCTPSGDQGQEKYEEQQRQRSVAALKRRAAASGFVITPTASVA